MFYRPWKLAQIDMKTAAALSQTTALPRLVCEVLCARGKTTPEAAAEMKGDAATLSDAMLIKNMDKINKLHGIPKIISTQKIAQK